MSPRIAEGLTTFAVDRKWRVYVDPDRLRSWTAEECAAVLLHEAGHLVRDHATRGDLLGTFGREHHHRWNIAGDLAINDDLLAEGARLPGRPVTPATLGMEAHLMEEEYYSLLRDAEEGDTSEGSAAPSDRAEPDADEEGGRYGGGSSGPHLPSIPGLGDCGSGADGRYRSWELAGDEDAPGLNAAAAAAVRIRVAEAVRATGKAPAGWQRWAEDGQTARRDWRQVLRTEFARPRLWRAGRLDRTWLRPDRREDAHPGLLLPGTRTPRFEIAVIIDTSGSMSDAEVSAALAEMAAVQRQCGIRQLWLITCDAVPSEPRRVRTAHGIDRRGGGGTDLRPAIDLLGGLRPRPDVALVITDGWTPWPERPPRGITLVVATTDRACPVPGVSTVQVEMDG